MPPPPKGSHTSNRTQSQRTATTSSRAATSSSEKGRSQHAEGSKDSEPRTSSRLANEKKKDYKDPPVIGPWKLGKLIGQGASGRVRHAVHTQTGLQAAIKIVPKQILASSRMSIRDVSAKQDKMTLGIEREIVIMKLIEHPNVLGLMDVYETSKELFLILEYVAGGELFDYLVSKGRLRPPEARAYFRQIIFGLHYCHSFNICHRDLKPENLLLDGTKRIVKVADFGMAALQPSEKMLETSCGSPHYASPEIVSGKSYKGTASDIWSCGIILFALLCGRLPFDDPNIQKLLGKVRLGKFDMPDYLEKSAKDLIWRMLTVNPDERIKMRDIMRHPWFTDNGTLSANNPVSTDLDRIAEDEMDLQNLDLDILSNLKTLWPEYSQQDLVNQLTSKGPNWQKTFYSLLVQHRENYSGDDEDDDDDMDAQEVLPSTSPAKGNSLGLSLGIAQAPTPAAAPPSVKIIPQSPVTSQVRSPTIKTPSQQARSLQSISPRPLSMVSPVLNASPIRPLSPVRPKAPIEALQSPSLAKKNAALPQLPEPVYGDENRRPISLHASPQASPMSRRPLPSPTLSPQPSPAKTLQSPAKGFGSAQHAQQALQTRQARETASEVVSSVGSTTSPSRPKVTRGASESAASVQKMAYDERAASPTTPSRSRVRSSSVAEDTTPKQNLPPRPSSRASTMRPRSAQGQRSDDYLPSVQLPGQMQQFFREIADELATIRVNGERPVSLQRKLEQLERMAAQVRSEARSQSPRRSPRRDDDPMAQFDDAEDDVEEDGYSVRSGTASDASGQPYSPMTPMTEPMTSPPLKVKPLAVLDKEASYARGTPSSLAGSSAGARTISGQSSSTIQSATSSTSSTGTSTLGRRRSLLLGRIKSQKKQNQTASATPSIAYERLQEAGAMAQRQQQTRLQAQNPGLGLDIGGTAGLNLNQNQIAAASVKSPTLSAYSHSSGPPTPSTPASVLMTPGSRSSSSQSSPKQSWFAGLFNWKPASCTLMSVENFSTTHTEIKRLLLSCGARVFVEDSENAGILKCSLADGKANGEHGSIATVSKPIRFRVEFHNLPVSSALASPALGTPRSMHSPALSSTGAAYATSVVLIQEKGSLSTFKQIYHTLRDAWTLDMQASTPATLASPAFNNAAAMDRGSPALAGLGVSLRGSSGTGGPGSDRGGFSPRFR
jgi:serine/threonine protein kinase